MRVHTVGRRLHRRMRWSAPTASTPRCGRSCTPNPTRCCGPGVRMFRGAARGDRSSTAARWRSSRAPNGVDLVIYPIGDGLINWVVMLPEADPGPLPGDAKWNQPGDRAEVAAALEHWNLGWLDAADLVRRTEPVLEYPMVDRDVLPWWGRGRVTLLGDAAHPMYPVGANGGSQAIVDARCLPTSWPRDFDDGLRSYEDDPSPRDRGRRRSQPRDARHRRHPAPRGHWPASPRKYRDATPKQTGSADDHLCADSRRLPWRLVLRRSGRGAAVARTPGAGDHADRSRGTRPPRARRRQPRDAHRRRASPNWRHTTSATRCSSGTATAAW